MTLEATDCIILGATLVAAILGMFGGFSGALAFLGGVGAAVAAVRFGWGFLESRISTPWLLALAALVCALLVFGVVRIIIKKTVKKMLAQPADAIFGALTAGVAGFAASVSVAYAATAIFGVAVESSLLREIVPVFL